MSFTQQLAFLRELSTMYMALCQSHRVKAYFFNIHGPHKSQFIQLPDLLSLPTDSPVVQLFPVFSLLINIAPINIFVSIFSSGAFIFIG